MPIPHQFEQVVREHQDMVFRLLVRLMGSRDEVDDLAQDVFLRLFRGLPGFRAEAQVQTYLYRIVVNVAHDARKRRNREQHRTVSLTAGLGEDDFCWEDRLPHPGPRADEQLSERELQQTLEDALQQIAPAERAVLVLYHQEERSYEEIAQALHMPVNTVRTHLHRGRGKLRLLLGNGPRNETGAVAREGLKA